MMWCDTWSSHTGYHGHTLETPDIWSILWSVLWCIWCVLWCMHDNMMSYDAFNSVFRRSLI